jgi:hypothetical protein
MIFTLHADYLSAGGPQTSWIERQEATQQKTVAKAGLDPRLRQSPFFMQQLEAAPASGKTRNEYDPSFSSLACGSARLAAP